MQLAVRREPRRDSDALEQRDHLGAREVRAEQPVGVCGVETHLLGVWQRRAERFDPPARDGAAGDLRDEPRAAIGGARDAVPVYAALEAVGRLGAQAESARAAAHRDRRELRALDQDVRGRLAHLGFGAADHAGERDRALRVGDHQVRRRERAGLAVERGELLAGGRAAHAHRSAAQGREVERVQRLAELEQDEVRRVYDVVDRAHARGFESLAQPVGRRADADAAHHACDVARAAFRRFDRNAYVL